MPASIMQPLVDPLVLGRCDPEGERSGHQQDQGEHGQIGLLPELWILDVDQDRFSPVDQEPEQDRYGTDAKKQNVEGDG